MQVTSEADFIRSIHARYPTIFGLCGEVMVLLEPVFSAERSVSGGYERVQDMLFYQAYKAAQSTIILSERALAEDAATIARRSLELAVMARYIEADGDAGLQADRSNEFLAALWHECPPLWREAVPAGDRAAWTSVYATVSAKWKASAKRKKKKRGAPRPTIRAMFDAAGVPHLYEGDYDVLCAFAHGSPLTLIDTYSHSYIRVHNDEMVPAILKAAVKYTLISVGVWNEIFGVIDADTLSSLADRALALSVAPS